MLLNMPRVLEKALTCSSFFSFIYSLWFLRNQVTTELSVIANKIKGESLQYHKKSRINSSLLEVLHIKCVTYELLGTGWHTEIGASYKYTLIEIETEEKIWCYQERLYYILILETKISKNSVTFTRNNPHRA